MTDVKLSGDDTIDVRIIIDSIRFDVANRKNDAISFEDDFEKKILAMMPTKSDDFSASPSVQFYRPINGNAVNRLIKKVVRKLVQFLIVPIVNDQNLFNHAVSSILERNIELEKQIEDLYGRINKLEKTVL